MDDCEIATDLRCVALPVRDAGGRIVAAISSSDHASRMTPSAGRRGSRRAGPRGRGDRRENLSVQRPIPLSPARPGAGGRHGPGGPGEPIRSLGEDRPRRPWRSARPPPQSTDARQPQARRAHRRAANRAGKQK